MITDSPHTPMYFPVSDEYAYLAEEEAEIGERPEWEQEAIRSTADILACENGDYVELPSRYEIDEYSIMDSYCNTVKNRRIADDLCRSICGKGAFRRFKDAVRRHGIEQDWYRYRDESYKEIAKDWCEENGIAYRD